MILIARDIGGTLECYPPLRADAGPTVQVVNASGGTEVAAGTAATLDSVNTTLAAGVAAGATTLQLTSGTSVAVNRRYLISATGGQSEFVEVKTLSGTTVTTKYPLMYAHANGAAFQGTRITYALAAAIADTEEDYWRAIFSWVVSTAPQPPEVVEFTVTRHPIYNPAMWTDVQAVLPLVHRNIATSTDASDIMARAWDEVLDDLWAMGIRPGTIVGSSKAKRAVIYTALVLLAEQYGQEFREERDEWKARRKGCLEVFQGTAALDADEDTSIEPHERRTARSIDRYRA